MQVRTVDGVDLYYEIYGQGPALVFAHGISRFRFSARTTPLWFLIIGDLVDLDSTRMNSARISLQKT